MRPLKLWGAVLGAVLVSMLALSASALAFPLPSILPVTEASWKSKGVGGVLFFTVSKVPTSCGKVKGEGTLTTRTLGEFHMSFEECKDPALGVVCTGLGDAAGVILVLGPWHAVVDVNSPELHAAILFDMDTTHLTCAGFDLEIFDGEVLCLVVEPLSEKATHEFQCVQKKNGGNDTGEPTETKYFNDKGELVEIAGLEWSFDEGTFGEAAVDWDGTMEFAKAVKFDD